VVTLEEYAQTLRKLLPRGPAWRPEVGTRLAALLLGLAEELVRIDGRARALIEESDPRTTFEMLGEYERVYGLPDPCAGESQSTAQRRASLLQKITSLGGQTAAYYIGVAAVLGFEITITEFHSHTVIDDVTHPLYGIDWNYAWQVNAPLETIIYWTVDGSVDDPLSTFGNDQLECVLSDLKPAHTTIIHAYS
jgi:uncharacterized protein YmfQ (DUF2313 family)